MCSGQLQLGKDPELHARGQAKSIVKYIAHVSVISTSSFFCECLIHWLDLVSHA